MSIPTCFNKRVAMIKFVIGQHNLSCGCTRRHFGWKNTCLYPKHKERKKWHFHLGVLRKISRRPPHVIYVIVLFFQGEHDGSISNRIGAQKFFNTSMHHDPFVKHLGSAQIRIPHIKNLWDRSCCLPLFLLEEHVPIPRKMRTQKMHMFLRVLREINRQPPHVIYVILLFFHGECDGRISNRFPSLFFFKPPMHHDPLGIHLSSAQIRTPRPEILWDSPFLTLAHV